MRIDQIDIDVADWPALSGTFRFPAEGTGVWATGNDAGKSSLIRLLAAALYGVSDPEDGVPSRGWLMVRLTLDDGEGLVVARDLAAGTLQVTDRSGNDVTDRWSLAPSIGEDLLGFTRAQFLHVTRVTLDELPATIGHPGLRAMLARGRGRAADGPAPLPISVRADPPDMSGSDVPGDTDDTDDTDDTGDTGAAAHNDDTDGTDNLPIFHTAAQEMEWVAANAYAGDRVLSLDGSDIAPPPAPASAPASAPTPEPTNRPAAPLGPDDGPNAELRAIKHFLDEAVDALAAKNAQYRTFHDELANLRTEQDRLGALDGAERGDVKRLGQLVTDLKKVADRREQVRAQESRFRDDLEARSIRADQLGPLDHIFREVSEEDRDFLEGHRQSETVLRGNQALTRSECRLDESRIQEIDEARQGASRLALAPLVVAAAGLIGSIAVRFLPEIPVSATTLLAAGAAAGALGAALALRARRLCHAERRDLVETLERKREQLTQFEHESQLAATRLVEMAAAHGMEDAAALVRDYDAWQSHLAELTELSSFEQRADEIDRETTALREQLASFTVSVAADPSEMTAAQLDAMVNDYLRYFTIQEEIATAEERTARFEAALADGEAAVAELRARVGAMLEAEEIDSSRDLSEAIEIHAMRSRGGDGTSDAEAVPPEPEAVHLSAEPAAMAMSAGPDPPGSSSDDAGPHWHEIDTDALAPARDALLAADASPVDATASVPATDVGEWSPTVSARTEAILRRFLPTVRDVEVDGNLVVHLRMAPDGPRLSGPRFPGLGEAGRDQVCLALRLAIMETLSFAGERVPVFLDDPFLRSDDARHDAAIRFLVEDASERGQIVFLTSHEVRIRWFQHQHPEHCERLIPVRVATPAGAAASAGSASPAVAESPASAATPAGSSSSPPS